VLPRNILYYRDDVSDSQYIQVKTDELPSIHKAFNNAILELIKEKVLLESDGTAIVNVTVIVVVKRHHVRFYPIDERTMDQKTHNCPSGTYVDSIVTLPYFTEFYLQSHAAIKGTAKPAHYFIVENEMSPSVDELRQLVSPPPL
jgi:eukaryotic translation initiation factor 2C